MKKLFIPGKANPPLNHTLLRLGPCSSFKRGDTMLQWIDDYTFRNVYFVTFGVPGILTAFWLLELLGLLELRKKVNETNSLLC